MKAITVADLDRPEVIVQEPRPMLLCSRCGGTYSADRGDYFMTPLDHKFRCCRRNMALVTKRVVYDEITFQD